MEGSSVLGRESLPAAEHGYVYFFVSLQVR